MASPTLHKYFMSDVCQYEALVLANSGLASLTSEHLQADNTG